MLLRRICASLLAILLTSVAAVASAATELPEPVAALLSTASIPPQAAGIVVMRGNQLLIDHNSSVSMQPASTMKVLTTLAALEQLGPAFRARTELRTSAELENGVLKGDLIVRGGADVDLNEDVLLHLLQALRNQGIRKIKGDVILDRQLFQPARPDVGQPPFDEYPWAYYNVIPDALLTHNNLLRVELRSSASELSLVMLPELEQVKVRAELQLIDAPCASWEKDWRAPEVRRRGEQITVVLHGRYPRNCNKSTSLDVLDHHDFLARLLRAQWRKLGGSLSGEVREAETAGLAPDSRLLAEHQSRALPELLRDVNKNSDNTMARSVFLMLGSLQADAALGSRPLPADESVASTPMRADLAIRSWLQAQRIDATGLVLENGSGLSRLERATPAQLAAVLQAGLRSPWMPEFLASLPIAGTDGTMRRRLKDGPATRRARIKTGTLNGITAIAGYVYDASNQPCIVVAFLNDEHVAGGAGRTVLDGLIDWVARAAP